MRTRPVGLVFALVLLGAGCSWPQWGGGPEHRGTNFAPGLTKSNIIGWVAEKVTDLPATSQVATANGLGFVEQDGRLVAFDQNSNAIVWSGTLPAGSTAGGAPAIFANGASSTVFVTVAGPTGPVLIGFDVDGVRNCNPLMFRCAPVFSADLGSTAGPATPPLVVDDVVYANGASSLYSFDAKGQTSCATQAGTAICSPLWSRSIGAATTGVGPTATNGVVYDPGTSGSAFVVRAFSGGSGTLQWTGTLAAAASATPSIGFDGRVFVPAGGAVPAFSGTGCGGATCGPSFTLARRTGDPAGSFLSTPAFDGADVFATNGNGTLSRWPAAGCGASSCQPASVRVVNAPLGGSTGYGQTPAIASGVVFVLSQQNVSGVNHAVALALDESSGNELRRWDFGSVGLGAGLADVSIAGGEVYAPLAASLYSVHAPVAQPLASLSTSPLGLSPTFSPGIFDYVVHCAAGTNQVTFTATATSGGTVAVTVPTTTAPAPSLNVTVPLVPNQAAVLEATDARGGSAQYWIRCLPPDFPSLFMVPHPAVGAPTPGWYLVGNNVTSNGVQYMMILDAHGTPVWYRKGNPDVVDFSPAGRGTVSWMPNVIGQAFSTNPAGRHDVYSLTTNTVHSVSAVGTPVDLHELQFLPNGDHLVLSYPLKRGVDLTGLPITPPAGPNSTIADCVVQQVNPQGQLVWQWTASDHIDPVTESTNPTTTTVGTETVYDVFHCNSIDPNPNGNVLVSSRHMSSVFEVRRSDGKVLWKMGGAPTSKDGAAIIAIQNDPQGGFRLQHDARYMPNGDISLYDNEKTLPSRAVEYAPDFTTNTAQLVFSYTTPDNVPSCCMGSFRRYPDGHSVIGWGYTLTSPRAMTELDAAGQSVLDLVFVQGNATYRATKVPPIYFDINTMRATAGL